MPPLPVICPNSIKKCPTSEASLLTKKHHALCLASIYQPFQVKQARMMRRFVITIVAALSLEMVVSQCMVCLEGQEVSLPDIIFSIPGYPPLPCGSVDTTLTFLVPDATSSDCAIVQSLGSLCGYPVQEDSCLLCPNLNRATMPFKELPFLSNIFGGLTPTCQILEAYLSSQSDEDSLCLVSRSSIADYCGCNPDQTARAGPACSLCSEGGATSDRNITVPDFPFQTCSQLEEALSLLLLKDSEECSTLSQAFPGYCGCPTLEEEESCSLCRDGNSVGYPYQPVELFSLAGIVPTCEIYESLVASLPKESELCDNAQLFGTVCGCPAVENHCVFCPGELMPEEYLDKNVPQLATFKDGVTGTCRDVESFLQYQILASSDLCLLGIENNHICGCSDGIFSYLSADTKKRQAVLAWTPRVSAFFSLIGSYPGETIFVII
jgi:hypothetical protein